MAIRAANAGGLGRVLILDERDHQFPIRALLPKAGAPAPTFRYWWDLGYFGDQGATSMCVGFAWMHWLEDGPLTQPDYTPNAAPVYPGNQIYRRAQQLDEWHGVNYEGTSVRGGAKALRERGLITEYRWGRQLSDLVDAVLFRGPCVVGTYWYEGMDRPDEDGIIHVTGDEVGGHAYVINGVNTERRLFRVKNSWGRRWGLEGRAWISFDDMERLIHEDGEICLAVEKAA